jgi:acetoin utilization protein AcuC
MSPSSTECSGPATVVFEQSLTEYDFGPEHPMSPLRVDLTMRLATELAVVGERLRAAAHRARPDSQR